MAQVPLQGAPSVAPEAAPPGDYQNIQPSPADFGGLVGAAEQKQGAQFGQAANDLYAAAQQKQQRFNQVQTDDAFNNFQTTADNLTYGNPSDPTAPKGLYTLRGADALRAGPQTVQSLSKARDQIANGLQNPAQKLQFNEQTRRLLQYKSAEISRHLDQQSDAYGIEVNKATMMNSARSAGLSYNSDDAIMHSMSDSRSGAVKAAQIQYGESAEPDVLKNATAASDTQVVKSSIFGALAQNDPQRANEILQKFGGFVDPATRAELTGHLKNANAAAIANGAVMGAIGTQAGIADAIHGQESGGRATSPTSVNGAVGGWQITPDTFQQYAHPGESISSPADNEQVGRRIVDDLSAKYGNDPARVAVGYFSGPGNVSPPGSATPWIQNHVDGNGTSTSQYVGGVLHRMGQSDPNILPASSISQPSGVTGLPDKDAAYARVLAQTADNPMAQRAALAQLDHLYAVQTKVARDNYEKAANPLVSQMISDPTKVDASRDIANNPAFNTAEKENLASMLHRQLSEASGPEKDTKTYGTGFWNYYKAVTADASDPGKITDPQVLMKAAGPGGELTVAGVDKLTGILQGKRTPEGEAEQTMMKQFLTNAKNQITGSHTGIYGDPIPDPKGDELYLKFLAHAMPAFDAGKKGGLTAPQLLDPGSKDYIGKAIATFHRPMAERMKDMDEAARNMLGTAAPGAPAAAAAPDLTTHDGIVAAYRSGKISRDAASQALVQGGFATPSTPVGVVPTN